MTEQNQRPARRIYNLDKNLSPEQMAVVFAMTSRSPEPFDEIARQVSEEKAADFHEKWVVGYGHSSVAEHAVLHLAVENISRLACDTLEDNRLASYTEKSSRYQMIAQGSYHTPEEIGADPELVQKFRATCNHLFETYEMAVGKTILHLKENNPQGEKERDGAYNLRMRRVATDSCRSLLPAATLTNVGMTANARTMEHAISKLLSSELIEERELGQELLHQGQEMTPTLIKYAAHSPYLQKTPEVQNLMDLQIRAKDSTREPDHPRATLLEYDKDAPAKLAMTLAYRSSETNYEQVRSATSDFPPGVIHQAIQLCLENLGSHEAPVREFENITYLLEFVMDYGAYREFKRHRILTTISQTPDPAAGYSTPPLINEAGLNREFEGAIEMADETYREIEKEFPQAAPYVLTHAHHRRMITRMNLRECYHLLKLRTSPQAHASIRKPMNQALASLREVHPSFFQHPSLGF